MATFFFQSVHTSGRTGLLVALTVCCVIAAVAPAHGQSQSVEDSVRSFVQGRIQKNPSSRQSNIGRQQIRMASGSAGTFSLQVADNRIDSQAIKEAARGAMQGAEYQRVRRRVLDQRNSDLDQQTGANSGGFLRTTLETISTAIGDFFEWLMSPFTGGSRRTRVRARPKQGSNGSSSDGAGLVGFITFLVNSFLYIGLAVLVVAIIWIIAMIVRKKNPYQGVSSDGLFEDAAIADLAVPPGELAASTYESRAMQFASKGQYHLAIRELLIGSMSWIERSGLIRFRKGLTNRDYLRAVWKKTQHRQAYATTASAFERVYFGRRTATHEMYDQCLEVFQGAFREESATAAN